MLDTRYLGWPLFDLSLAYRLTGDPELLDEARITAGAFRNTARYSPIGFMTTQINALGDDEIYGSQGPFCQSMLESASQCYAHFQQGIIATGLVEYYLMSRDLEAMDALFGFADHISHHAMLHDAQNAPVGWTYTFGDYWGPYTDADLAQCDGDPAVPGWFSSNFRLIQPLGQIALLTGRTDYRDVLDAALGNISDYDYGSWNTVIAGFMGLEHDKTDAVPPSAVTDLQATSPGAGSVSLSWTAPGDDDGAGTAHRCKVKYSTAAIVERVEGWPDRTAPLPTNAEQWATRAAAFNAQTRPNRAPFAPFDPDRSMLSP